MTSEHCQVGPQGHLMILKSFKSSSPLKGYGRQATDQFGDKTNCHISPHFGEY